MAAVNVIELLDPTSVDLENRRPKNLLLFRYTSTCPLPNTKFESEKQIASSPSEI
jgi:hypothetical protein